MRCIYIYYCIRLRKMLGPITRAFEQECLDTLSGAAMVEATRKPFKDWTAIFFGSIVDVMTPRTVGWYDLFYVKATDTFNTIEYLESIGESRENDASDKQVCEKIIAIYDSYLQARHHSMWGPN